jgi:hypothetical protein
VEDTELDVSQDVVGMMLFFNTSLKNGCPA